MVTTNRNNAIPAKITPPSSQHCLLRDRLFAKLATLANESRAVWISAPAGSGKTSLATSFVSQMQRPCIWYQFDAMDEDVGSFFHYLTLACHSRDDRHSLPPFTSEYHGSPPTFARHYFRRLLQQLPPGTWLLFDDHQELSDDSPLQQFLQILAEELLPEHRLLILSRKAPPPSLARQQLYGDLKILDEADLQFSRTESRQLFSLLAGKTDNDAIADKAHRLSHGWAAGLRLMIEGGETVLRLVRNLHGRRQGTPVSIFCRGAVQPP